MKLVVHCFATGSYCREYGEPEPTGECYAGFYCAGGASLPDAYNDSTGYIGKINAIKICILNLTLIV